MDFQLKILDMEFMSPIILNQGNMSEDNRQRLMESILDWSSMTTNSIVLAKHSKIVHYALTIKGEKRTRR